MAINTGFGDYTLDWNSTSAVPVTYTFPTTTITNGTVTSPTYYQYTSPPTYKFEFTSPLDKKLAFLRMPCGFSKHDLFNKLGHLPDDVFIVNTWHDTLSNSIIFLMTSDKFLMCNEGTNIPEIVIEEDRWDYKTRLEFTKRVEERND